MTTQEILDKYRVGLQSITDVLVSKGVDITDMNIENIGEYIDKIPTEGEDPKPSGSVVLPNGIKFVNSLIEGFPPEFDFSGITDGKDLFNNMSKLQKLPDTFSFEQIRGYVQGCCKNCIKLSIPEKITLNDVTHLSDFIADCKLPEKLELTINNSILNEVNLNKALSFFYNESLKELILTINSNYLTNMNGCLDNLIGLKKLTMKVNCYSNMHNLIRNSPYLEYIDFGHKEDLIKSDFPLSNPFLAFDGSGSWGSLKEIRNLSVAYLPFANNIVRTAIFPKLTKLFLIDVGYSVSNISGTITLDLNEINVDDESIIFILNNARQVKPSQTFNLFFRQREYDYSYSEMLNAVNYAISKGVNVGGITFA